LTRSDNQTGSDVDLLLDVMPPHLREAIAEHPDRRQLFEIVLDLGRPPEARFENGMMTLAAQSVSNQDIDYVVQRLGRFTDDNRAGIERTLHRISAIRNRTGAIIGLTCRVGRALYGTGDIIRDVIESGASILLLGPPGVGKTTLLRESARVLADDLGKRVIIVDTSNEIGGDGDIPHPGIGGARRMQVQAVDRQHAVMIEAVENHMPQIIVIDEIGTAAEALAARTIAERGVQLIATAHGNTLENLLQNPTLSDLVGGVSAVTLSDDEARRRGTQKTVLERKAPPTFTVLVEIQNRDRMVVHQNVAAMVDALLRGMPLEAEVRQRNPDGGISTHRTEAALKLSSPAGGTIGRRNGPAGGALKIFSYGVSRNRLERAIEGLKVSARVVSDLKSADLVLTLKSQKKRRPRRIRDLQKQGIPLYVLKSNTIAQMESFLKTIFELGDSGETEQNALHEAESAVSEVFLKGRAVALTPREPRLRRLQHQVAAHYGLTTESRGRSPHRRVVILPPSPDI
jgi:stage III sporulation protein SpoIIIAA